MNEPNKEYLDRAKTSLDFINNHFNKTGYGFVTYVPNQKIKDFSYQFNDEINIDIARHAALLSCYPNLNKCLDISKIALRYLVEPQRIKNILPAKILVANEAIMIHPLKITIIGARDNPVALALYMSALKFPSFYIQFQWYSTAEEARALIGTNYPTLSKPAAFFCANDRCSLPIYDPNQLDSISKKIASEQLTPKKANVLSPITSILPKYSVLHMQQTFANIIITRNWLLIFISFWGIGLLLAFTPCVLPMLLVLSTFLLSFGDTISKFRIFTLSVSYVISLAFTYALIGLATGWLGSYLQIYLQSPVVLISISIVLVLLAFSLLCGYKIKMPLKFQHYLVKYNTVGASNTYIGAALMGIIVTLIASPCTAAPVLGVLSLISEMGGAKLGIVALFAMGLGIGTPLLFVGIAGQMFSKKIREWQLALTSVFGLFLLAIAIWISARVIPPLMTMYLLAAFCIVTSIYMGILNKISEGTFSKFWKTLSIMIFIYGVGIMIGSLIGNNNPFNPLALNKTCNQPYQPASLGIFQKVNNTIDIHKLLALAKQQNKPVILDFYASWCESCNRIERDIFNDPDVSSAMLNFMLLRIDLTTQDKNALIIAKKYNVLSPPAIILIDGQGDELDTRFYGSINKDDFVKTLTEVFSKNLTIE
ncbi:MAG: protein-disulfide reductase DsbD family protein [Gammaproteobacteria bacterium]